MTTIALSSSSTASTALFALLAPAAATALSTLSRTIATMPPGPDRSVAALAPSHRTMPANSYSLPREISHGRRGLLKLGCSPRFFRKWMEFQFEESGRRFDWANRGMEWEFARFDVGAEDACMADVEKCQYDASDDGADEAATEAKLEELERAAYEKSGADPSCANSATRTYVTRHWSNYYPRRKGVWETYDFSTRSRTLRRFLALHVFGDVVGVDHLDGAVATYDRDSWMNRSLMT